jgi:hypothetical protein
MIRRRSSGRWRRWGWRQPRNRRQRGRRRATNRRNHAVAGDGRDPKRLRRPSTRFTTLNDNEAVAHKRRSNRHVWGRMLRGDLDWVIPHALEKDPARRYQSASEFAQDLRRYLEVDHRWEPPSPRDEAGR